MLVLNCFHKQSNESRINLRESFRAKRKIAYSKKESDANNRVSENELATRRYSESIKTRTLQIRPKEANFTLNVQISQITSVRRRLCNARDTKEILF